MAIQKSAAERRSVYRVEPATTDHLQIAVVSNDNHINVDEIIDIAITGAAFKLPDESAGALHIGDTVTLNVISPELPRDAQIQAKLIAEESISSGTQFRFEFERCDDLLGQASKDFFRLFNRRAAYRGIKPSAEDGIELGVKLTGDNTQVYLANLENLSSTGACVAVDPMLDNRLRPESEVALILRLPNNPREINLPGLIRNRYEGEQYTLYGVQFDWTRAEDPLGQAEEVLEYVLTRFEGPASLPTVH